MGVRTVRLDDEMEKALQEVMAATGLSASAILKRGIETLRRQLDVRTVKEPAVAYETRPTEQTSTAFAIYDGESTWLEGFLLLGLYVVIAAAFWWG